MTPGLLIAAPASGTGKTTVMLGLLRALRDGAYRHVYTSDRGTARSDAWLQARNTVGYRDGAEIVARIGERVDAHPHPPA